jgi:hypothetical protein
MYFDKPGRDNTDKTVEFACARAKELGIDEVVVASSRGYTAHKVLDTFKGFKVVVVTYHCGFKEPFQSVMPASVRMDLESVGATVISATHALSGVERSLFNKFSGAYPVLIIADTLRLFGQGTKVAVEVAIMATDGGALTGKDIVSIGGTGKGADTALILKPADQSHLFDIRIREVVCKPRSF